jgi:hypothetical protein
LQLLFGHTSPETAYVVEDYPYGFRLRCKIRYWLEFKAKKGFRLVSQTTVIDHLRAAWDELTVLGAGRLVGAVSSDRLRTRVELLKRWPAARLLGCTSAGTGALARSPRSCPCRCRGRGVAAAGGEPSGDHVAGLRILIVASGTVYWATDSMSLPRGLNQMEVEAVHGALERHFQNRSIVRVERLECIPR